MPDTVGQLLRDLNLQSSKLGISFTGLPIAASGNFKQLRAAGGKYLIGLKLNRRR